MVSAVVSSRKCPQSRTDARKAAPQETAQTNGGYSLIHAPTALKEAIEPWIAQHLENQLNNGHKAPNQTRSKETELQPKTDLSDL